MHNLLKIFRTVAYSCVKKAFITKHQLYVQGNKMKSAVQIDKTR